MKKIILLLLLICLPQTASAATYIYTVVNSPQVIPGRKYDFSYLSDINNNGIIGSYSLYSGSVEDRRGYSFLYDGRDFSQVILEQTNGNTEIISMNDNGLTLAGYGFIGEKIKYYIYENGSPADFVYPPGEPDIFLRAVNNFNHYTLRITGEPGFPLPIPSSIDAYIYDYDNGQLSPIVIADEKYVYVGDLNDFDVAVGMLGSNRSDRLFIFYKGEYIFYDLPEGKGNFIRVNMAINNRNILAGNTYNSGIYRPFVLDAMRMSMSIMEEDKQSFYVYDNNDAGQLVGSVDDDGFLASPYYMDSDSDADSDGADLATLAVNFVGSKADQDDLVNFSQNFGRTDHHFMHLFRSLDPDKDQDSDGIDLAALTSDLQNRQADAANVMNFAANFGRTSNVFRLIPLE